MLNPVNVTGDTIVLTLPPWIEYDWSYGVAILGACTCTDTAADDVVAGYTLKSKSDETISGKANTNCFPSVLSVHPAV